jgi:hypothetical protein
MFSREKQMKEKGEKKEATIGKRPTLTLDKKIPGADD